VSRRHAQLHLPPLSARDALAMVDVLERAITAAERAHGDEIRHLREMRQLEARARRHGVTIYDLDADPDATSDRPGRSRNLALERSPVISRDGHHPLGPRIHQPARAATVAFDASTHLASSRAGS